MELLKPARLQAGDRVATISLSWGGAGDLPARYAQGKRQIEETFGLEVVETRHALRSADWIHRNPQARAEDLNEAFADPSIKAIVSNIGGEDSVRILPWIDYEVIRSNPKIFMGYSDTTVSLFAVLRAGVVPFYGPAVLSAFAENGGIFPYLKYGLEKVCFQAEPAGLLKPNEAGWSNERLEWDNESLLSQKRQLKPSSGWRWLQGEGLARGHLMGGCVEVLEFIKATPVWPDADTWKGCLLFLETSEEKMAPMTLRRNLRNYGAQGILANCAGLMLGRPYDDVHWKEYDEVLLQVVRDELGLEIPIVSGMDFGHSEPMLTVPIGVSAELDCAAREFRIVEAAVSQA